MNSILVPVDFSDCSKYALDAGMALATSRDSRLHLVHVLEKGESRESAEIALRELLPTLPKVDVELAILGDTTVKAISAYVAQKGIDLLVMGSHGASGKQEYFIGSNTQKVVRSVHCPVLVIKEPIPQLQFEKVVFASNFNDSEKTAFLHFKNFVKHYLPEIHLVHIQTTSFFEAPMIINQASMKEFAELARPMVCKKHLFQDLSVERGVRVFAEEIGADLIAISNYERHPVRRMLRGSKVEALINHSSIPILSIDFNT